MGNTASSTADGGGYSPKQQVSNDSFQVVAREQAMAETSGAGRTPSISPSQLSPNMSHDKLRRCLKRKGFVVADSDIREVMRSKTNMIDALTSLIDSGKARKMVITQRGGPNIKMVMGLGPPDPASPPRAAAVHKRGRSGEFYHEDASAGQEYSFEAPGRVKAVSMVPTATLVGPSFKRFASERPPRGFNAIDRWSSNTDRPLMELTAGGMFHDSEVFGVENRPTEAFVLGPVQRGSPPCRLSTTLERSIKGSPRTPTSSPPAARPFPNLPDKLDLAQMENKMVTGVSRWDEMSKEEKHNSGRRLWHDLALPALEASRQTRVEGELSALIMAALEDLAASPSAPHGAELLGKAIRKVRISIHETSLTIRGRYSELYTSTATTSKPETSPKNPASSDSDIRGSGRDTQSNTNGLSAEQGDRSAGNSGNGGYEDGLRRAGEGRGKDTSHAMGEGTPESDDSCGGLSVGAPAFLASPNRAAQGIIALKADSRFPASLRSSLFNPQTPTRSRHLPRSDQSRNYGERRQASPLSANATMITSAATVFNTGAIDLTETPKPGGSSHPSWYAGGGQVPVSSPSAVSADKLPPEPPEEKAYWHAINICKEALKPTRRDRKEVEWLQHHIERVRQIGAQQIGECAAELNKHKDEVTRLNDDRLAAENELEAITKEVIGEYLGPGASKEESLRALLTNIQKGSDSDEHSALSKRKQAIQTHQTISEKHKAASEDLRLLQRANAINMLLIKELYGDVIDILSGLALHAVEKRVLHQSDLKATAKEALSKMVGAITFHVRRKQKAEAKIQKGLQERMDDKEIFGDDYVSDSGITQEQLKKLRHFAHDSTVKIAKIKQSAEGVRVSLHVGLEEDDIDDISDEARRLFASGADLAAAEVSGSNPNRFESTLEAVGTRVGESDSCVVM